MICSTWQALHAEVKRIQEMFLANAYPLGFLQYHIGIFMQRIVTGQKPREEELDNRPNVLILPYYGDVSNLLRKQIDATNRRFHLNIKVVLKPFKIGSYFSLKTRCPKPLRSKIVYRFNCSVDQNIAYIGKTKRHLITRVKEHTTFSATPSAVYNHILTCNCSKSIENFDILESLDNTYDLSIAEALYIRDLKPSLNATLTENGQSLFLKL